MDGQGIGVRRMSPVGVVDGVDGVDVDCGNDGSSGLLGLGSGCWWGDVAAASIGKGRVAVDQEQGELVVVVVVALVDGGATVSVDDDVAGFDSVVEAVSVGESVYDHAALAGTLLLALSSDRRGRHKDRLLGHVDNLDAVLKETHWRTTCYPYILKNRQNLVPETLLHSAGADFLATVVVTSHLLISFKLSS